MNFVKAGSACLGAPSTSGGPASVYILGLWVAICLAGCSDQVRLPSARQLTEFENAGPVYPTLDKNRLSRARVDSGPYRVEPGEVLEITMPAILQAVTPEESVHLDTATPYICRVGEGGSVELPVVGELHVRGKTCAQIEESVVDKYFPEYAAIRPSVLVRVLEHMTVKVPISGAVQRPGIYSLRRDQMSLLALLMAAGGIVDEGAARIEIIHSGDETRQFDTQRDDEISRNPPGSFEGDSRLIEAERAEYPPHHRRFKELNVELAFKPVTPRSTRGALIVTRDADVLLNEPLDVTSRIDRRIILEVLAQREPLVSIASIEQTLCELAEQLKPGSSERQREIEVAAGSTDSSHQNNVADNANMSGQRPEHALQFSTDEADLQLWKPARVMEGTFDLQNSERITSSGKFLGVVDVEESNDSRARVGSDKTASARSIILPVEGFNIPFADVALQDGDSVIVERLSVPLFTVAGLVNRPGNFPYPPRAKYNLMQAIAFAGGLNPIAEPRYASVYRLKPDNTIVNAAFEIINTENGSTLTDALGIRIKPGDIIFVEHTPRTRAKLLLDRMFHINVGAYYGLNEVFDD
ncbi:MAG: polysaccharide biosynthesis/export family protein [Planctomycetota bacterium]